MEVSKEISFFKKLIISLKDFDKYKVFINEKVMKSIKYIFQLLLIFTLIITIGFSIKYTISIINLFNYIKNDFPDFSYENGTLDFNDELIYENQDNNDLNFYYKILINTKDLSEEEISSKIEEIKGYDIGIIFFKDKILINNKITDDMIESYNYSDLQSKLGIQENFNKQDLINYTNSKLYSTIIKIIILMYVYLFLSYFISILFDSLILSVLAFITSRIVKVGIKFSQNYSIAIHALTLPIILNIIYIIVNLYTGFYIKYFDIMYTAISYIYVIAAILSLKSDIIKETVVVSKIEKDIENENLKAEEDNNKKEDEKENKNLDDDDNIESENESGTEDAGADA